VQQITVNSSGTTSACSFVMPAAAAITVPRATPWMFGRFEVDIVAARVVRG
jgi:hypothetical protein